MKRGTKPRLLSERLWEHVDKTAGPDACWPFTGAIGKKGYGRIKDEGRRTGIAAHRVAYRLANPDEPLPNILDHSCHVPAECPSGSRCLHRRCCNPAHLKPSSNQENGAFDRQWTRSLRTHCARGHQWTEQNTGWRVARSGRLARRCRRCAADDARGKPVAAYYRETQNALNAYVRWTADEDRLIASAGHLPDLELSRLLQRSVRAIQNRRNRLGGVAHV